MFALKPVRARTPLECVAEKCTEPGGPLCPHHRVVLNVALDNGATFMTRMADSLALSPVQCARFAFALNTELAFTRNVVRQHLADIKTADPSYGLTIERVLDALDVVHAGV